MFFFLCSEPLYCFGCVCIFLSGIKQFVALIFMVKFRLLLNFIVRFDLHINSLGILLHSTPIRSHSLYILRSMFFSPYLVLCVFGVESKSFPCRVFIQSFCSLLFSASSLGLFDECATNLFESTAETIQRYIQWLYHHCFCLWLFFLHINIGNGCASVPALAHH